MKDIDTLRSEVEFLDACLRDIADRGDPDEQEAFDDGLAERKKITAAIDRHVEVANLERAAEVPARVTTGDGARVAPVPGASTRNIWDMDEARSVSDSPTAFAAELRSRAADAIEQNFATDDYREQQTRLLDRGGLGRANGDANEDAVARHWLTFANPEYRENFGKALRGDMAAMSYCQGVTSRAWAGDGTTTTGGFAIVPDYDVTLLLINAGTTNPFRQISRVVQTNSNTWYGLSTAGVTAGWITEATEEGDDTPAVAQPSITIQRAGAYLQASLEVVADSNLGAEVGMLIADAKDTLEASAFATGTGGGQPYGVVTQCQTLNAYVFGDSGSTVEKDIVISDIYALDNALGPRWRQNASFVANKSIWNQVRQLDTVGSGNNFWVDFGAGLPPTLIGYPVYESSAMDSTIVSGSQDDVILLGDFRNGYIIADRIGMTMQFNPLVVGTNRRPTGEVGWFAYWRTGANVADTTNASHFKLLHK